MIGKGRSLVKPWGKCARSVFGMTSRLKGLDSSMGPDKVGNNRPVRALNQDEEFLHAL